MYSVIDLFAGAGGLSLGFIQTNRFDVKVAFENSPHMQETYKKNHPHVEVFSDVISADYNEIKKKYGTIDVVIGGPPCQGFSNANRQKNHAVSQNNMLVKQYIRAICELQPKAFVMENVSMLRSDVHRFYLDENDVHLIEQLAIPLSPTNLLLLEKEYMFDEALELVNSLESIENYIWPEDHYSVLNIVYKATKNTKKLPNALQKYKNKILNFAQDYINTSSNDHALEAATRAFRAVYNYYNGHCDLASLQKNIEPAIMIQRMLSKAKEIYANSLIVDKYDIENGLSAVVRSYAVFDYIKAVLKSDPNSYALDAGVLNAAEYGAPQKRKRFVVIGVKKEISDNINLPVGEIAEDKYRTVRDAFFDLEDVKTVVKVGDDNGILLPKNVNVSSLAKELRDTDYLYNHVITDTTDTALERFRTLKQGQNFHSLSEALKTNTYTDISRTQNTIYLRLNYDQPSGTVVNVRKSMWIHPVLDRAVSVREAARLQTFPDSFVFYGTKDKQYQQVGNAVPPIMAKAIAEEIIRVFEKTEK